MYDDMLIGFYKYCREGGGGTMRLGGDFFVVGKKM